MDEFALTALVAGMVIAVVFAGMLLAWRAKSSRQAGLGPPDQVPADRAPAQLAADGLYLATTIGDRPYERVVAGGLGFRARARVEVGDDGVLLELAGATRRWIPAERIRGAGLATWTIGRVVDRDGLALIGWRAADTELDTYVRVDDPAALVAAVDALGRKGAA